MSVAVATRVRRNEELDATIKTWSVTDLVVMTLTPPESLPAAAIPHAGERGLSNIRIK